MNYRYFILSSFLLNILLFSVSISQNNKIHCISLTESDSALHHPEGLIDNIGKMDPNWLSEKIDVNNFYLWYAQHFNIPVPNVLDTSKIDIELKKRGVVAVNNNSDIIWLLKHLRPGDEVWYYTTPDNYWASLSGRDGIVLIRKCRIIVEIIFTQS